MSARHPRSDPSRPPAAERLAADDTLSPWRRTVPVIVGLVSGWAALALPFYWLWPGPDTIEAWGPWLALVIDSVLAVGIVSAAVPLVALLRDGRVRRFAVGLLLSLAGVGCLLVWGYLYLVFG